MRSISPVSAPLEGGSEDTLKSGKLQVAVERNSFRGKCYTE